MQGISSTASASYHPATAVGRSLASRMTARAQFAAADRLLQLGAQLQSAPELITAAGESINRQTDALAAMATGLGSQVDVYG